MSSFSKKISETEEEKDVLSSVAVRARYLNDDKFLNELQHMLSFFQTSFAGFGNIKRFCSASDARPVLSEQNLILAARPESFSLSGRAFFGLSHRRFAGGIFAGGAFFGVCPPRFCMQTFIAAERSAKTAGRSAAAFLLAHAYGLVQKPRRKGQGIFSRFFGKLLKSAKKDVIMVLQHAEM